MSLTEPNPNPDGDIEEYQNIARAFEEVYEREEPDAEDYETIIDRCLSMYQNEERREYPDTDLPQSTEAARVQAVNLFADLVFGHIGPTKTGDELSSNIYEGNFGEVIEILDELSEET